MHLIDRPVRAALADLDVRIGEAMATL